MAAVRHVLDDRLAGVELLGGAVRRVAARVLLGFLNAASCCHHATRTGGAVKSASVRYRPMK